jgi:hypothetical protein
LATALNLAPEHIGHGPSVGARSTENWSVIPASACADRHCAWLDADCDALAVELRFGRVLVEAVSRDALGASVGATTRTMAASMPFKLTGCGGAPRSEVLA